MCSHEMPGGGGREAPERKLERRAEFIVKLEDHIRKLEEMLHSASLDQKIRILIESELKHAKLLLSRLKNNGDDDKTYEEIEELKWFE